MSRPDPIFDKSDRTALEDDLPPELKGKTPKEIHDYYKRREEILLERSRHTAPPPPPPRREEPVADEKIDIFGDPTGSINRVVDRKVNEQMNRIASTAAPAIINSCRLTLRERHADYPRFAQEIERRMASFTAEGQMNPEYWEITYKTVKGELADTLVTEALEDDRKRRENPVERPTPPGQKPPQPKDLSDEERKVAKKFGMTDEDYRNAQERYDREDGRLPFTMDTRLPRRKKETAAK